MLTILMVNSNLFSQPVNDECANAFAIPSIEAYCSGADEFTTADATTSTGFGIPILCFPAWDGDQNDVWFTFSTTASITDVTIDVIGMTMEQPQMAIYRGDCGGFAELTCTQAGEGTNNVTLDVLALDPSETYYIRINAATTGSDGTFQLCIDEFSSDIITNTTVDDCDGVLYDTGGPDGNYGVFESFEYAICPSEPHGCISINLVSYDIEPIFDNLSIYNGADSDAPLLESIDGMAENVFFNIPTTGCVTLTFTSDGGVQRAGFELTWSCALTCPTPPPDFQTCSGTFYDSGGPDGNYANNEEITTIICPHPDSTGSCVYVNFTEFEVENGFDDLFIYDGPTADAPLIGAFTDTDGPGLVFSSDSCITVVFDSDGSVTDPGWVADITCLPCGTPPPCVGVTPTCDLPDACDIACDLGTLDSPTPCPFTTPVTQSFCLDNTGAMPTMPYIAQADCMDGNDMPDGAADIWYSFQASSNELNINITSFLSAASVALYQSETSCETLIPVVCNNSTDGGVSLFAEGIQPGDTYFLQISGADANDMGEINLDITTSTNCDVPIIFMLDCGDGVFTDSGGENDDYQNGENIQTTICPQPDSVGQCVLLNFLSFEIENGFDDLFIYDGEDTNAPLIGEYTDTDSPGVVVASDSCLTVVFQSDGSVSDPGWVADILCVECGTIPPCLGFTPECDLPDNCEIACSLDTLNSPTPCPFTSSVSQSFCLTNVDASASMPYIAQTDCFVGDSMANPAADVWYSFVAASNELNITAQSELLNINVGVYEGDVCDMLTPVECFSSENGNAVLFLTGIQFGGTYHIQFSGGDTTDVGEINLEIESSIDCSVPIEFELTCADSTFTDTGGPVGDYASGELILTTICPEPGDTSCVLLNFLSFETENGFDDLFIYDGEDTNAPLIDEYTGSESPGAVIASGGCLTILFDSDGSVTAPGWVADILCVECGTIPPCLGETPTCDFPDDCSSACDLGALDSPTPCPFSTPAKQIFCIDNIGATAEPDFEGQVGCDDGSDVPSPAADVWYSFVAASNQLAIEIQSELSAASVGLYQGSGCGNLLPLGCNNSETGNVELFAVGIQPDSTYYVQISGADENDQGMINLTIESSNNCDFCVITAGLTAEPTPVNNTYPPGDTVTFCLTVTEWNQTASNWFHAVVPEFGPGWDVTTLTPTVFANSCDLAGVWLWQESITGTSYASSNVGTVGPGFVYDSDLGGPLDGNGENNFGDNCSGAYGMWEFCWSIAVSEDCNNEPGALNMVVETYGDSETGSWGSAACEEDVAFSLGLISCDVCVPPTISSTITPPDCAGNGGEIQLTVADGIEPYTYTWDAPNIGNTADATGLAAGIYNVTVEDAGACVQTAQITIDAPELPVATAQTTSGNCDGGTGGEISVSATGGTPPYQYSNDGGMTYQAANTFPDLPQGTYDIAVQDALGCIGNATATVIIGNSPTIDNVQAIDASCNLADGTISITANGGTPPYQYSVDGGTNLQTDATFSDLPSSTYDVVVLDAAGCEATSQVLIEGGEAPAINIVAETDPSSCGTFDGAILIVANGGTPPLEYSINNGMDYQSSPSFDDLGGNTYNIVVQDALSCFDTVIVVLDEPLAPVFDGINIIDPACGENTGSIEILVSEGTPNFQYSIDDGLTFQGSNVFENLDGGSYNIVVEDFVGCQINAPVILTQLGAPVLTDVQLTAPTCGDLNGSIDITAEGGTTPYEYSLDGMNFQDGAVFSNLVAGTYTVVVRDAEGCEVIMDVELTTNGAPVIADVATTDITDCNGNDGTISITINGGTAPYEYSISNGMSYQFDNDFANLSAGIYNVVIRDANGCVELQVVEVLGPSDEPEITNLAITDANCGATDGAIEITVNEVSPPYEYSIDGGTTFQASNTFTGLSGGIYDVVIVDADGCQTTDQVTVNSANAPEITNIDVTNASCGEADGSISIDATAGTTPYTYSIDGGTTFQSAATFTGLDSDTYDIVVLDGAGCEVFDQVSIVDAGMVLIDDVQIDDALCDGGNGQITVVASGGAMPYGYSIDNGQNFQSSNIFNGLTSGAYNIVVQDVNGCEATQTLNITSSGLPVIDNVAVTSTNCGESDGTIEITASGGTPTYQFSIDGGMTFQGSNLFEDLAAGTYDVVIKDFSGCETATTATIPQTADLMPEIILDGSPTICPGQSVGLYAGEYAAYEWSTGETSSTVSADGAGIYNVTVTDASGCTGTATQTILEVNPFTVDAGDDQEVQLGNDYSVIGVSQGTNNETYSWSGDNGFTFEGPAFNATANEFGTIIYTLTVTSEGCTVTDQIIVTIRDIEIPEVPNVFSPNGDDLNDTFGVPESASANVTTFRIFNRWGELVHDNAITRWDGTFRGEAQEEDVYTYYIVIERFNNDPIQLTGDVFLMR